MKLDKDLEKYILDHADEEEDFLVELDRETNLNVLRPRMLSGHLQGKILEMISRMIKPMQILEIGTYTGYSAICLAKGLQEGGKLHTIEVNDELEEISNRYFKESASKDKIIQHIGDAKEIIPKLDHTFDLVFMDGDKREYSKYFDLIIEKLPPNAFIIADNILWSGKVVEEVTQKDDHTVSLIEFNNKIKNDKRVSNVILPFRDGLMIIRRI